MKRLEVSKDSTIGKILLGKTRGINNWYVRYILNQRDLFILETN